MKAVVVILVAISFLSAAQLTWAVPPLPDRPTTTRLEGWCGENGGTYWPPGPESSTYGCILPDGSVVVCGGSLTGCDVIEASAGLPPSKLPLEGVNVTLQVQTQTQLSELQEKLGSLETMVEDLGVLVEEVCEPPIFVP